MAKLTEAAARVVAGKPACMAALRDIASGRLTASQDGEVGYLEEWDGVKLRDPEFPDRKLLVAGIMTLVWAGYLTEFCTITPAGRAALEDEKA